MCTSASTPQNKLSEARQRHITLVTTVRHSSMPRCHRTLPLPKPLMVESPQNGCPALRTATVGVGCVLRAPSNCLSIIIPLVYHKGGIDDNNAKFPIYLQFEPTGTALLNNVQKKWIVEIS